MTPPGLPATLVADLRDVQPPVIAGLLLGACLAKLGRVVRRGTIEAVLGPTQLFPLRLRRPLAMLTCAFEMSLGLALVVTVLPVGTRAGVALFAPRAATGARVAAATFFLVAVAALVELRGRRPDLGCGCFGDFSTRPACRWAIARAAVLTAGALISVESPALYLPLRGHGALLFLGIVCAELALIAALSPEVSEALVRLGYTDPCELRQLRRPDPRGAAPQPAVAQARPGDHHRAAQRHVAGAVLAVCRLPVPPGRGHRGSSVRDPAEAAPSRGPGRRPAAGPGWARRPARDPRGSAGPGPAGGYALI